MENGIHKVYEEILSLLSEKNEKIYQMDSVSDEFLALEESLILLRNKAENLLSIKKSFMNSVKNLQENQRVRIDPIQIPNNTKPNFWLFAVVGMILVIGLSLSASRYSIKELFLVR